MFQRQKKLLELNNVRKNLFSLKAVRIWVKLDKDEIYGCGITQGWNVFVDLNDFLSKLYVLLVMKVFALQAVFVGRDYQKIDL